jgi:hypothetical protein
MCPMSNTATVPAVHIQGWGLHPAKPAVELAVGDVTVWNGCYTYTVTGIAPKGKQSLTVTMTDDRSGKSYDRVLRRSRLVAVTTR